MFSRQITSQSHSLHLGNSPPCWTWDRRRAEKERGKRRARELLPEAVLQKSG